MTMIEKAESIIGCEGACFDYITFKCTECPIHDNCPTGEEETVKAAKAYLAEHNEWKPLELSSPPDLTLVYDFQMIDRDTGNWEDWELENTEAICELEIGETIRYKDRQQEPSVEDMAQEYYRNALNPTRIEMYIAGYNKAKGTI